MSSEMYRISREELGRSPAVIPIRRFLLGPAGLVLWLAIHLPLAVSMRSSPTLATFHGLLVIACGVWIGLRERPDRVLMVGGYIVGSEVLWRMSKAQLPWEAGKYFLVLVLGLALIRRPSALRLPALPALYLCLLLPAALLTIVRPEIVSARSEISFNLSGPLSLAVAATYCAVFRFTPQQIRRVMGCILGPLLGVAAVGIYSMATAENLRFYNDSNALASGGFGPNQVSTVLGFGALLSLVTLLSFGDRIRIERAVLLLLLLVFAGQSAMTFSRGGLYGVVGSVLVGSLFWIQNGRTRHRFVLTGILVAAIAITVVLPKLDTFTGGILTERFRDTNSTGRGTLIRGDLKVFLRNPLFGVGPGVAAYERHVSIGAHMPSATYPAHTELSRMLAEHGIFGLTALVVLVVMAFEAVRSARGAPYKAGAAALIVWSILTMMHVAMRLAAPGFAFGLALAVAGARRASGELLRTSIRASSSTPGTTLLSVDPIGNPYASTR